MIDIDTLKAGPELDAEVAKACGFWQADWYGEQRWFGPHRWTPGAKAHASLCLPIDLTGSSAAYDGLPKFSTDYTAAFAVFIIATEKYGTVFIHADMEEWGAEHPVTVQVGECRVLWLPFPEAICRAFLGAKDMYKNAFLEAVKGKQPSTH